MTREETTDRIEYGTDGQLYKYSISTNIPEREKGEWISDGMWYKCSACGTEYSDDIYNVSHDSDYHPNFCPKCGADMRGELNDHT